MADNWDDNEEDDEWDVEDDDELDARLGLKKLAPPSSQEEAAPVFDDEEDLALKEKVDTDKTQVQELKKKGNALAAKKKAEEERQKELLLARKAVEMEAEMEANLDDDELRKLKRQQVEEADHALTNDLFGGVEAQTKVPGAGQAVQPGDTLVLKDLKDHLKHAHKVAECMKEHGKITLAAAFVKELIEQSKDVLDEAAIGDIIKICNVIKNEKVQAAKRKSKGQAQKSQKRDKVAEAKAKQLQVELYGDSNKFDRYDAMGEEFEDDFF